MMPSFRNSVQKRELSECFFKDWASTNSPPDILHPGGRTLYTSGLINISHFRWLLVRLRRTFQKFVTQVYLRYHIICEACSCPYKPPHKPNTRDFSDVSYEYYTKPWIHLSGPWISYVPWLLDFPLPLLPPPLGESLVHCSIPQGGARSLWGKLDWSGHHWLHILPWRTECQLCLSARATTHKHKLSLTLNRSCTALELMWSLSTTVCHSFTVCHNWYGWFTRVHKNR